MEVRSNPRLHVDCEGTWVNIAAILTQPQQSGSLLAYNEFWPRCWDKMYKLFKRGVYDSVNNNYYKTQ